MANKEWTTDSHGMEERLIIRSDKRTLTPFRITPLQQAKRSPAIRIEMLISLTVKRSIRNLYPIFVEERWALRPQRPITSAQTVEKNISYLGFL